MGVIDLEDIDIKSRVTRINPYQLRLTVDYPGREPYLSRIRAALANLIKPEEEGDPARSEEMPVQTGEETDPGT